MAHIVSSAARGHLLYKSWLPLLEDRFPVDEVAPMVTPHTCLPGPGTLNIVDTGNKVSTSNNTLILASATISQADPRVRTQTIARVPGRASICDISMDDYLYQNSDVWITVGSGVIVLMPLYTVGPVGVSTGGIGFGEPFNVDNRNGPHRAIFVARSGTSSWFVIYRGKMIIPAYNSLNIATDNTLSVQVGGNSVVPCRVSSMIVTDLKAPWNADHGIALYHNPTPATGETFTGLADSIVDIEWTPDTNEILNIATRRTDDDNCWIVRCNQATSKSTLIKREAGIETVINDTAQTWTVGTSYRIMVFAEGTKIWTYVNKSDLSSFWQPNYYATATFNQTAAGGKVTGFTSASELVSWPRDVSALLPTIP